MPLTKLTYNDNDQEHRSWGDTLGQMQGQIEKGTLTKDTSHACYSGHELRAINVSWDGIYLKKDCPGKGKTTQGRSQNRIIVRVTTDGKLVDDWAVAWRHDDRLLQFDEGFFKRGKTLRDYIKK